VIEYVATLSETIQANVHADELIPKGFFGFLGDTGV
jgi:hypothetical protein